jgi:hypothetical protein
VELISPLSEGVSPPFPSLFELIFDTGGGSGDMGDILRLNVIQVEFLDFILAIGISRNRDINLIALAQVWLLVFLYSSILVVLLP